jgi:hypothetical protein
MSDQNSDEFRNPLQRSTPLGGPVGVAIVSVVPIAAVILAVVFGYVGSWSWSWLFFLLIPLAGIVVYGFRSGGPGR